MFIRLLEAIGLGLEERQIPYMIIGGQAVLIYGEPRLTRDIDVTLGVGPERLADIVALASASAWRLLLRVRVRWELEIEVHGPKRNMARQSRESTTHLRIHRLHGRFGVAGAGRHTFRHGFVNACQIFASQGDLKRPQVFFEVILAAAARNGKDILALREHPGERELRRRATLLPRTLFNPFHHVEVFLELLSLKARGVPPPVVGSQILKALDSPGQETAAERAVGDKGDAKLAAGGDDFVLWFAAPER